MYKNYKINLTDEHVKSKEFYDMRNDAKKAFNNDNTATK